LADLFLRTSKTH